MDLRRRVLLGSLLAASLRPLAHAQGEIQPKTQTARQTVQWNYRVWPVEHQGTLQIVVPAILTGDLELNYAFGVRVGEGQVAELVAGEVAGRELFAGRKVLVGAENLADRFIRVAGPRFAVLGMADAAKSLALLATARLGTKVELWRGETLAASGVLGKEGLLFANDKLIQRPMLGMKTVIRELMGSGEGKE